MSLSRRFFRIVLPALLISYGVFYVYLQISRSSGLTATSARTFPGNEHFLANIPLEPARVFQEWKRQHSVEALRKSPYNRTFIVATYSCPRQAGNILHDFLSGLLQAVVTNRTFLWNYETSEEFPDNVQPACERIVKRADWIPSYKEWNHTLHLDAPFYMQPKLLSDLNKFRDKVDRGEDPHLDISQHQVIVPARLWRLAQKFQIWKGLLLLTDKYTAAYISQTYGVNLSATMIERLYSETVAFVYGMLFSETFQFTDELLESVQDELRPYDPSEFSVALHSRHVNIAQDGSNPKAEIDCLQHALQLRDKNFGSCRVYVMSDRPKTIDKIVAQIGEENCRVIVAPHPNTVNGTGEHGPFAGAGFFQDLAVASQATQAFIGHTRSSSALVADLIEYRRRINAWKFFRQQISGSCFTRYGKCHDLSARKRRAMKRMARKRRRQRKTLGIIVLICSTLGILAVLARCSCSNEVTCTIGRYPSVISRFLHRYKLRISTMAVIMLALWSLATIQSDVWKVLGDFLPQQRTTVSAMEVLRLATSTIPNDMELQSPISTVAASVSKDSTVLSFNGLKSLHDLLATDASPIFEHVRRAGNVSDESLFVHLNISFSCDELFRRSRGGTGNWVRSFYATRLAALQLENVDLSWSCTDAEEQRSKHVLPWLSGYFPAVNRFDEGQLPSSLSVVPFLRMHASIERTRYAQMPFTLLAPLIRHELRRLAVAVVGVPHGNHEGRAYQRAARNADWTNVTGGIYQVTAPAVPLFPNIELDDVVLHFRCGDLVYKGHAGYTFRKFSAYSKYISAHTESIGIVTQPFDQQGAYRKRDARYPGDRCRALVEALVHYLQGSFPGARVRVHNGPNETLALSYARMVMANQAFASVSSFSVFPAVASFGTGFLPNPSRQSRGPSWFAHPFPVTLAANNLVFTRDVELSSSDLVSLWETEGGQEKVIHWFQDDRICLGKACTGVGWLRQIFMRQWI